MGLAAALLMAVAGGCGLFNKGAAPAANTAGAPADGPVKNSDRYKVKADTAPFFHYGPQQLNGSDLDLKKDTRITMLNRGRGFSQVRTVDGQVGYVGTEDITPLSAEEIAAEDAQKLAAMAPPPGALTSPVGSGPVGTGGPVYTIPSEAGRSESLPTQDASPTPKPPPPSIFRY